MKHPRHYDTDARTSARMARTKLKRGDAEVRLAKALYREGYRYRLNDRRLPGSPDIAILRLRIAVFVDGEFWHGRDWEDKKPRLKRNREYWIEKIEENMSRDRRVEQELLAMDWVPIRFWAKDVEKDLGGCIKTIEELALDRASSTE